MPYIKRLLTSFLVSSIPIRPCLIHFFPYPAIFYKVFFQVFYEFSEQRISLVDKSYCNVGNGFCRTYFYGLAIKFTVVLLCAYTSCL